MIQKKFGVADIIYFRFMMPHSLVLCFSSLCIDTLVFIIFIANKFFDPCDLLSTWLIKQTLFHNF